MIRFLLQRLSLRFLVLVAAEAGFIVAAVMIAAYVRLGDDAWDILLNDSGASKTVLIALVTQGCLYYSDLYNLRHLSEPRGLFTRMVGALASASFILALIYFWFPSLIIGRGVFIVAACLVITFMTGWRFAFKWLSGRFRPRERLLLVGTSDAAVELARELFERRHDLGVEIVGFVDSDPARVGAPVMNPGVIGTIDDIPSIVRARNVDRVVVSLADARGRLPMDKLLEMKLDGVAFDHLASVYEDYTGKIAIENLRPSWLIFSDGFRNNQIVSATKRLFDVSMACVGLVVAAPIMAAVAVAIRLSSSGPIMYHQRRVGRHGRIFVVHKFRSMRPDAEATIGPTWAAKDGDPRVTAVGRWLRRVRLDELPQLWNILKGDMSVVGPRPERPEFVTDLAREIRFYGQRHIVRPGLTGWAQVRYTYAASTEDALQKLQYDLYYIKHLSIAFDLFIIFYSIKTIVLHRGN